MDTIYAADLTYTGETGETIIATVVYPWSPHSDDVQVYLSDDVTDREEGYAFSAFSGGPLLPRPLTDEDVEWWVDTEMASLGYTR